MSSSVYITLSEIIILLAGKQTNLIVTSTEDEFCVWVKVEDSFDDFALVDGDRANFKVLLADED